MRRILILFAHPAFEKSRVNRQLIRGIDTLEGVTFHDLYQRYPEMDIDTSYERALIERHDIVLLQYPFYLFGMPALMKEWMDLVLVHGWAFGSRGNALNGKWFGCVITTGGSRASYCRDGYNRFSIRELTCPLEQVAHLCRMQYLPPFVVHGTNAIRSEEIETLRKTFHSMLGLLGSEPFDLQQAQGLDYLNEYPIRERNS
ncbi:MAG: NAD(P)H-dependent oxidoreductase [Prosthecochloris sp.]|uniref:NAD(P)H dehydrogenase (Quinone) n=1 Tax=Prosthecochloris aestuarii (strain DSM 271 / SK 413) TaxID=290512 RepID=B4S376_PROA2|nr:MULTISPECIES: NAD(P)H-dependent oxidoreductase [Prosthecochloris]ACF45170.1 NAD(P)H dehydrogenase (quinone) [Prosthecochloris aestuarii DSM 271]MCW8797617.1 NAD(P)H-dependent oxidoreductase [Prosthecochloris sp.]RDD31172.1 NAD(P)H oxidoreductase [Prosthecochloris sp. ZM]